ncbi:MAG: sensor domain-containing protein [Proteobacteria bacterium]|nr:sensor domain-containing protein [Pseudomonadota bacterium]
MNISPPPDTVKAYLSALQRALKGCSPGLISDALADCEEHLNNEMAQQPETPEVQILASVVETYGTPEEIAEEYRSMEASISGPFPKTEPAPERRYGFFGVIGDPRTYGSLLYTLLSIVTGTFYFAWTLLTIIVSILSLVLFPLIPIALLLIGSIRVLSLIEGRIVEGLLGIRMPRRLPAESAADETIIARIKAALADIRTWSSVLYLFLLFPWRIISFVLAFTGTLVPLTISVVAFWVLVTNDAGYIHVSDSPFLNWAFHTAPGLVLTMIIGFVVFFLFLHVIRGIGWLHGRIAELLLVRL